ncbi:Isoniazid-inducible protein iniA, partial [cyanobacterium TDX16]
VDTPGVGGLGSTHGTATMGALPLADAVLFVTDASQELTAPEVEFLKHARQMCPNVVMVLTKTDFYPEWRRIQELDRGHLERLGLSAPIVPVSSTLHGHAVRLGDQDLDAESGFPALLKHLKEDIVGRSEDLVLKTARSELLDVVGQLQLQFETEKQALDDPEQAAKLVTQLEAAKEKALLLKTLSARW